MCCEPVVSLMVFCLTLQLKVVLGRHHLAKMFVWRDLLCSGGLEVLLYYKQKKTIPPFLRSPGLWRCLDKLWRSPCWGTLHTGYRGGSGGQMKQCGFPSQNRLNHRDIGNNKWIKVVRGHGKKMCGEKLEPEKGEAASRETASVSVPWMRSQWVTDLQDNSNITFHDCN